MRGWPFADPENTAVFTTRQVVERGLPILWIWHDEDDGAWQFLCGTTSEAADLLIVGLAEIVRIDPSVSSVANLPRGWKAWRSSQSDSWKRSAQSAGTRHPGDEAS